MPSPTDTIRQVRDAVEALEQRTADGEALPAKLGVGTGWDTFDAGLPGGGLRREMVHEWFGAAEPGRRAAGQVGEPPLSVLVHLARRGLAADEGASGPAGWAVWIGRHVWPYPPAMGHGQDRTLLSRSLFVDPPGVAERLWAADLAARSPAVAVVVLDGRRLDMAATRRLQLASRAQRALVLTARSPDEMAKPSAAGTRWRVTPMASPTRRPQWRIELLRCKGEQRGAGTDADRTWIVEANRATGLICVSAGLADPAPAAAVEAGSGQSEATGTRRSA